MPTRILSPADIAVGDLFEDCSYKPRRCVAIDGDTVTYHSLIPSEIEEFGATASGQCSIRHCGLRKLSPEEASVWVNFT